MTSFLLLTSISKHNLYTQHFLLSKEKREVDTVIFQVKKIITHTIVAGFSEFLFYTSAIFSEHRFAPLMSA
jgi:hypothetical protein